MDRKFTIIEVCLHAVFCILLTCFFIQNSFLRPSAINTTYKEVVAAFLLFAMLYLNYLILIPKLFFKRKFSLFSILALLSILVSGILEMILVFPNIKHCAGSYLSTPMFKQYIIMVTALLILRNFGFFCCFFLLRVLKQTLLQNKQKEITLHKQHNYIDARNTDGQVVFVKSEDILYCEQRHNYSWLHTITGEQYSRACTMLEMEELLGPDEALRISRKHLVLLKHVSECNDLFITLKCGQATEVLKISSSKKERIQEVLQNVLKQG